MATNPLTTPTTTTDEPVLRWASCPLCWGQRRIWSQVEAANGEGSVLVASHCPGCLGVGEVLR
jgi:hypothetical protein